MNWNQIPRIPQRDGYGQGLLDLCAARPDVVVLDADVAASTRTNWVRDRFPDHFYNLGISEQDLVGTAAGLALGGQIPYVSTYGVFLSGRAFDQIRTTVISVGGYRTPAIIDRWLNAGKIEGISLSRPLILDPALPNKWKNGSQEKARCISCNKCFASAPLGCGAFSKDA